MQDPADKDPIRIRAIDDDMFPLLDAPVSASDLIARASQLRSSNQALEAIIKAIKVALCLPQTPRVHGIFGDFDQVEAASLENK
jgi:hypothetical protein